MPPFQFDDADQYVHGTPHHEFRRLRREAPLAWQAAAGGEGDGFWLVTRYRDVVAISKNPELFATHAPLLADPIPREMWPAYPALAMLADNLMTFRLVMKEVALEQGIYATFMPKPYADQPGSAMHTHLSLFEGDTNAFHEPGAPYQLSKTGRQFIAGLLHHGAVLGPGDPFDEDKVQLAGIEPLVELVALAHCQFQVDLRVDLPELPQDPGQAGDREVVRRAEA